MAVSVAVCEIFSVKEWCDLENMVRFHLRSLNMAPFVFSATAGCYPVRISWRCLMLVKLEWLGYRMVEKLWRYVNPFSYNTSVLRIDRRTDRIMLYQYRASAAVCWRAIKTRTDIKNLLRTKVRYCSVFSESVVICQLTLKMAEFLTLKVSWPWIGS